jgi:hypothetical protein
MATVIRNSIKLKPPGIVKYRLKAPKIIIGDLFVAAPYNI